ncbi:MAG: PadR family transcriptional regulator [Syntrophomonadaceae bacterium]|nr:PadR family transcriptional regulator [Syntrophomonadaceae bacterium]
MISNSTVDYIILGCLSIQPMSGYDIKRLISISTGLFYNASYGSIYPTLKKFEEAGLVNSEEVVENGRFKKIYALTYEGQREFMEWLEEPPRPIVIKNDMLLRLFFYRHLPQDKVLSITASHIEQLKAFKLELEEIEAAEGAGADKFQRYTLRWGMDFYDFQIGWYKKILLELDD